MLDKKDIFITEQQNISFKNDGYLIMPFLNDNSLVELESILKEINIPETDNNIYHSAVNKNTTLKGHFHHTIKMFLDAYLPLFQFKEKFKILLAVYINKKPSNNSAIDLHTDDSLCDERIFNQLNVWIPLTDVNFKNGTICICKDTHTNKQNIRVDSKDNKYIKENKKKLLNNFTAIEMKKGDALVYNPSCIHFSPPNKSNNDRPVVAIILTNENAKLSIFKEKKGFLRKRVILKYELTVEEFFNYENYENLKPIEIF